MTVGTVIALDIATTTGWAWHQPGLPRPIWGHKRLPGGAQDIGKRGDALEQMLRDIYILTKSKARVSHIFFEAQHVTPRVNMDTICMLLGLSGITEKFAYQVGAHCYKSNIGEWRKHFLGVGSGFKARGQDPKELAIQRCAQYGWHTAQPDEADALGILDFSLSRIPGYERPWRDKALLGGGR